MNPWHLDRDLLQRYEAGSTDLPLTGSVEAHLIACATCRRLADGTVPAERLARIWQNIEAGIDARQPTTLRRILARLGLATLVLALAQVVTNLPRPSLRTLGAMAGAMLFLVIPIWARSSVTIGSRPGATETAVAASSGNPAWIGRDGRGAPQGNQGLISLDMPVTAADLPAVASALVAWRENSTSAAMTIVYLKPCLLAAIDRTGPLVATIVPYQRHHQDDVAAAIVVFPSLEGPSLLDVYVVSEGCADKYGQLLAIQKDVPRTPDDQESQALA